MANTPRNRPALGRGLSSLIVNTTPEQAPALDDSNLVMSPAESATPAGERMVAIASISANPHQPRRHFEPEHINELAESIKLQGVLQPLLVTPATDGSEGFLLIAGERRLRAATQAGLAEVPCIVRDATPLQMTEWAMIENLQREDLNAVELAEAYRDFMDRFKLTQAQVAEKLSIPRTTVANTLRVIDLDDMVQAMLIEGVLSFGHAKVLAGLAGQAGRQRKLAQRVVDQGLTVRQLEGIIATADIHSAGDDAPAPKPDGRKKDVDPHIRDLQDQLTRKLGVRVTIKPGKSENAGKLVVDYYSLNDFDRILEALGVQLES
jgi:ParB family chromosome partitioning protein